MFKRHLSLVLGLASACSIFNSHVSQAASQLVRIDGSLFDSTGIPVTGNKDIQIRAYDASSAGTLLWTSSVYTAAVSVGRFSVDMDASTGGTSLAQRLADAGTSGQIWFEIDYDTGAANGVMNSAVTVTPRIRSKGTLFAVASAKASSLSGVTATAAEMNYLSGTSANIQTQINALAGAATGVSKLGDSMSGALSVGAGITSTDVITGASVNVTSATGSRVLVTDASKNISSSSVTSTELGYLSGITTALSAYLNGLTANVQSQLNTLGTSASGAVARVGDTMTGGLGLNYAGASASGVVVTDVNRLLKTSSTVDLTELDYLDGLTSNLGAKLNPVTSIEISYLSGVTTGLASKINGLTANVQTQIDARVPTSALYGVTCATGSYLSGFDSGGVKVCTSLPQYATVSKYAAGGDFACALISDGTVMCSGQNSYGQLGNGTTTASNIPVFVRDLDGSKFSNVTAVDAGYSTACAVKSDGTAYCWGYNGYGELGDGSTINSSVPVQVYGVTSAVQISVSGYSGCVRNSNGTVRCWGLNSYGNLGNGTTNSQYSPVAVSGITNAIDISNGNAHACAVLSGGTAKCWGWNGTNQLGDGTTTQQTTPVAVTSLTGVTTISAGSNPSYNGSTCAVKTNGTVWCWGSNGYGQLGVGDTSQRSTPTQVMGGLTNAVLVSTSVFYSCAMTSAGKAKCWGYNGSGTLGEGTTNTLYSASQFVIGSTGAGNLTGITDLQSADVGVNTNYFVGAVAGGRWYSWGANGNGQYGDATTTTHYSPRGAQAP